MALAPVLDSDRISSIDVVRGTAVLGIALMNIVFSGLPLAAIFNPHVAGGATGANLVAFFLQFVLFDGRMRGLFSMMFGASAWLLVERLQRQGGGFRAAEIYYRRLLWLMVLGVAHAYLIWHGDILYAYALLGLVLLPLLRAPIRNLLVAAGVLLLIMTGQSIYHGFSLRRTHTVALQAIEAESSHKPLTKEQKTAKSDWDDTQKEFSPPPEDLREETEMFRGSYFQVVVKRAGTVMDIHSTPYYLGGFDMFAMMLIGIAFMKSGVLSAQKSPAFYWRMLIYSTGLCLPVNFLAVWQLWKQDFGPIQPILTFSTAALTRAGMTLSFAALILLFCKYDVWPAFRSRLAAVGRTAFSNYIAQSLIYGFVFYGYGFNLYGKLQRYQLYYVVLGMWIFALIWSPLWLRHFRFGPLEWAWRSLTYWKLQPMRIQAPQSETQMR